MLSVVLLIHTFATLSMLGVIWFVQIVHYPLFADVGDAAFCRFESAHQRLTTWIVAPLMISETVTAGLLLVVRPPGVRVPDAAIGLGLVVLLWASTFLWQVPLHGRLSRGFDAAVHKRLVRSNWLRTVAWTARGLLVCRMCWLAMAG